MRPTPRLTLRLGILLSAAMVLLATPLAAQDCAEPTPFPQPEDLEPDELAALPSGPWSGSGVIVGTGSARDRGITLLWDGTISADFQFVVEDDPGPVSGEWTHIGGGLMTIDGIVDGYDVHAEADLTFEGSGPMSGTNSEILLDGSSRTQGSVTSTVSGVGSTTFPVDNTSRIPTLDIRAISAVCDEAHGDWVFSAEQAFVDSGLTPELSGYWTAWRLTEQAQAETQRVLEEAAAAGGIDTSNLGGEAGGSERSPFLDLLGRTLADFQRFVGSFPDWSPDQVFDKLESMEYVLNLLRGLSPCDARIFGEDNVESFISFVTHAIQNLVIGGTQLEDLDPVAIQHLTQVAVRTGAIGAGAVNPYQAALAEQTLVDLGEQILEANTDPSDGGIFVNAETRAAMATGAAMGWNYNVNGEWLDPRATWEAYAEQGGDTWQEQAPELAEECGAQG